MQPVSAAAVVVSASVAAAAANEDETIFATAQSLPAGDVDDDELGAVGGEGVYPHGVAVASTAAAAFQVLLFKASLYRRQSC